MTLIAIASGIDRLDHCPDLLAFSDYARYPGSIWYHGLAQAAAREGLSTVGAGAVLARIERGEVPAGQVLLVQEQAPALGQQLLQRGARGAVLTSLESPLYAAAFYAGLPAMSSRFHASVLFPPFQGASHAKQSDTAFFPRELPSETGAPAHGPREGHCVVATYRRPPWRAGSLRTLSRLGLNAARSATVRRSVSLHLLSTRVALIRRLSQLEPVFLYGRAWPAPARLSPRHENRIRLQGLVDDKQAAMRQHRFNICLENTAIGGYVTEKFADAVEAGCVPVYSRQNLVGAVGRFDEVPFVDTDALLAAADPQRLLQDTAARFDRWAADAAAVRAFLAQFDHHRFARLILDRVRSCAATSG